MNRNGVIFFNETIVYLLPLIRKCPDGEIGRRTVFRSQRSQGCAGSNPVPGTSFWVSVGHFISKNKLPIITIIVATGLGYYFYKQYQLNKKENDK